MMRTKYNFRPEGQHEKDNGMSKILAGWRGAEKEMRRKAGCCGNRALLWQKAPAGEEIRLRQGDLENDCQKDKGDQHPGGLSNRDAQHDHLGSLTRPSLCSSNLGLGSARRTIAGHLRFHRKDHHQQAQAKSERGASEPEGSGNSEHRRSLP